jgi:hypothetical protein
MNALSTPIPATNSGAVEGRLRVLIRLEALAALLGSLWAFAQWGQSLGWAGFAATFLLPDLALLAYLAGPRWGAWAYNGTHSAMGPALLLAASLKQSPLGVALALVWFAHIGFDRSLGFGLKYREGFHATHLGYLKRPSHQSA